MKVFTLENLATSTVSQKKLEDIVKANPKIPATLTNKADIVTWREDANTKYVFFSPFEGLNTHIRITERGNNPAWILHGLVIDFDMKMTPSAIDDSIKNNMKREYPVAWTSQSCGGGCHMVFEFEEPVNIITKELVESFIKTFMTKAGVPKLGGGFDKASTKPHMYYTFGSDWKKRGGAVGKNILQQILHDVGSNRDVFEKVDGLVEMPFDTIEQEIEKRWPGRWKGGYRAGSRGVRFWDATATDPSKCIMHSTGVYYFSDGGMFRTWKSLFGSDVVAQYEADRVGASVQGMYYDGKKYYRDVSGLWLEDNKGTIMNTLKIGGLRIRPPRGEQISEVDRALGHIETNQRVEGALPFIYNDKKIVHYNGQTFINTATVKPIQMADVPVDFATHKSDIYEHCRQAFGEKQLKFLLYWFGWQYFNAVHHNPQLGQSLFLVGKANTGKTLLGKFFGEAMGGSEDIGAFLLGRDDFNENMFRVGICTVDDDRAGSDQKARGRFTAILKQLTANPDVMMRKMYSAGKKIPWPGKIVITMNSDATSLSMLPNLDMSNADKLMILLMKEDFNPEWPRDPKTGRGIIEDIFRKDLPFFCRGCYDLIAKGVPKELDGGPRFGVKSYIHPTLKKEADFQSTEHSVKELLAIWKSNYFADHPSDEFYSGTGTHLLELLLSTFDTPKVLDGLNGSSLPQKLVTLHRKGCEWIEVVTDGEDRLFKIYKDDKK